jgi:glycerol-3-phosphate acyltransferase PlsY
VRAVGPVLGGLVLLLDVLKGLIPGILATVLIHDQPFGIHAQALSFLAGCIAILGHMFSPWIGFKGGKGIATGLGAMLAAMPLTAFGALVVMVLVTAPTRYVSLGSIIAGLSTIPISIFIAKDSPQVLPILIVFNVVVIYKHRANIIRLLNGTENKFGFKKSEDSDRGDIDDQDDVQEKGE